MEEQMVKGIIHQPQNYTIEPEEATVDGRRNSDFSLGDITH